MIFRGLLLIKWALKGEKGFDKKSQSFTWGREESSKISDVIIFYFYLEKNSKLKKNKYFTILSRYLKCTWWRGDFKSHHVSPRGGGIPKIFGNHSRDRFLNTFPKVMFIALCNEIKGSNPIQFSNMITW